MPGDDTVQYKSVSDLNLALKGTLEKPYANIKVSGEISNFKISNKNLFATLKDNDSTINLILWGYGHRKNQVAVSNGDTMLIHGKIILYQKSGSYCLQVSKFEKVGMGTLHQEYELLKGKYEQLGYFKRKREFPQQINRVGIVTALEGAALQDILYVLKKNNFSGKVVVRGCIVQGTLAPQSIADGISALQQYTDHGKKLDVIIVGRGGGSFEDLIAFSSPTVIEAIYSCSIFMISAVGHETDFMLSDFVAERAPTPSVSAEIVSTHQKTQLADYLKCKSFIGTQMKHLLHMKLGSYENRISLLLKSMVSPSVALSNYEAEINMFRKHMVSSIKSKLLQANNKLDNISGLLQKHDIQKMLEQGYAILFKNNNRIVDSISDVKGGQRLKLKLKDGVLDVIAEKNA
jgi:exodeoxyribonuclease VII large subunit